METKEIKITPPEGYEIDRENSTFDCIKFKSITRKWRDDGTQFISEGYYINIDSQIIKVKILNNCEDNHNVFATEKQAKSALAIAQISQIIVNDKRFGGPITDEEWGNSEKKYCIGRRKNNILINISKTYYEFLAFHTREQRDLFLKENEDLVKDYLMLN